MDDDSDKPFGKPISLTIGGQTHAVRSAREALDLLSGTDWPGERGPRHRDARDTCLKVLDGHRSTEEAEREFVAAAREAGIAIT